MNTSNTYIFHSGTKYNEDGDLVTDGGRVLSITTISDSWEESYTKCMEVSDKINFDGKQYRRDIGLDTFSQKSDINQKNNE